MPLASSSRSRQPLYPTGAGGAEERITPAMDRALAAGPPKEIHGCDTGFGAQPSDVGRLWGQPEGATGQCVQLLEADLCIDLSPV